MNILYPLCNKTLFFSLPFHTSTQHHSWCFTTPASQRTAPFGPFLLVDSSKNAPSLEPLQNNLLLLVLSIPWCRANFYLSSGCWMMFIDFFILHIIFCYFAPFNEVDFVRFSSFFVRFDGWTLKVRHFVVHNDVYRFFDFAPFLMRSIFSVFLFFVPFDGWTLKVQPFCWSTVIFVFLFSLFIPDYQSLIICATSSLHITHGSFLNFVVGSQSDNALLVWSICMFCDFQSFLFSVVLFLVSCEVCLIVP